MKDNFSTQSAAYSLYRPRYPKELFEYIVGFVHDKKMAWDAGTGNGQTAAELAGYFEKVFATDISTQQLEKASLKSNIIYALEPAENISLSAGAVNLVTVSQALHWFDFEKFYGEVKRVAAPGAIFAAWCYSLLMIEPAVDSLIQHFHFVTLKECWDEERKYVDDGYETIPFPFKKIVSPVFQLKVRWNLQDLEGYLNTWSAVQQFMLARGNNPVPTLMNQIRDYWRPDELKSISFPIHLKMGYVH